MENGFSQILILCSVNKPCNSFRYARFGIQFGFVQKNVSDLPTDCALRTTNRQCLRRGFCIIRFLVYPQIAQIHTDWFPIVSVVSNRFLQFLLNHRKQFGSRLFKKHFLKIFNKI